MNLLSCRYPHLISLLLMEGLYLLPESAFATHIRAGEIYARRQDAPGFTYEITLRGYGDTDSQVIFGSNGTLDFGDGTSISLNNDLDETQPNNIPRTRISEDTWLYEKKFIHSYAAAGTYTVSFREFYRNEGILNMDNAVNMPFYVETVIMIADLQMENTTPIFKRYPIDRGFVGVTFHHQPGAYDADGDSLAYKLIASKQDRTTNVANYRFPHLTFPAGDSNNGSSESGGAPTLSINPNTGDIIWDAPGTAGEYNITFQIQEWRKINGSYQLIGHVIRDMQIIVEDMDPLSVARLTYPFTTATIAPTAGENVTWTITAQAPTETDSVILELWGDFLNRTNATASSTRVKAIGEAAITINWTGEEDLGQHYQLIARAYNPYYPYAAPSRSTTIYYNPNLPTEPEEPTAPEEPTEPEAPLGTELLADNPIKIYPNPLTGNTLYLQLAAEPGRKIYYALHNMDGRLVQRGSVLMKSAEFPLTIKPLEPGIYLLKLEHSKGITRSKISIR